MRANRTLLVLGMHRSGTSLTANWMHEAGISMGDALLEESPTNAKGYYEDKEFLQFHRDLLAAGGQSHLVTQAEQLPKANEYFTKRAEYLVRLKSDLHEQWGWKDPRTVLFLPFWQQLIPQAAYLVVYRHYIQTVDSLLRRRMVKPRGVWMNAKQLSASILHRKEIQERQMNQTTTFLQMWVFYNQQLLNFVRRHADAPVYVVEQNKLTEQQEKIERWLADTGFSIQPGRLATVYEPKLMKQRASVFDTTLVPAELLRAAETTWQSLNELGDKIPTS